MRYSCY